MGATALRIGAFNVQSFGDNKASDPDCGSVIAQVRSSGVGMGWEQWRVSGRGRVWDMGSRWGPGARPWAIRLIGTCICGSFFQILAGYDIALVQEVRDPDLSAVSLLMEQINRCVRAGHHNPSQDHKLGSVP